MTIEQGAIMNKYRNDCSEINRRQRQDWESKCLALKILRDVGKRIGAKHATTT